VAPQPQVPLQSSTELVKVDVSVLDKHGDFVSGLTLKDFQVMDNGAPQPIIHFRPVEAPAQVLVLIETSPAVYLIHNQHLVAAYALLDGLAADDEVAVVTYDQSPRAVMGFTADKSALLSALGSMQYTIGMGDLNLYDSISTVLDWIAPAPGKRALVLLTTGLDSSPPSRWDALVRKLRGSDVVIFSVGLGGALRGEQERKSKGKKNPGNPGADESGEAKAAAAAASASGFERADGALRSLATITGGRAYFPEREADFVPAYREVATSLRHQYVLGIAPAHDGQFHPLSVGVLDQKGQAAPASGKKAEYRVFAREGYLAPGP